MEQRLLLDCATSRKMSKSMAINFLNHWTLESRVMNED